LRRPRLHQASKAWAFAQAVALEDARA
jgi:hypothetical protein